MLEENAKEVTLQIENALKLVEMQLREIMWTDNEYYSNFSFVISNEQMFVPYEDREPDKIYIVIKFQPADIPFGCVSLPITLMAISEANGMEAAQRLLMEYAQVYNQKITNINEDNRIITIYQNYVTPSISNNFEIVYDGYRSVLVVGGSFFISYNVNRLKIYYYDVDNIDGTKVYIDDEGQVHDENGLVEPIELQPLMYSDSLNVTPDTQPYFQTKNFTESINKYGTLSITFSFYLLDNALCNKALDIKYRIKSINTNFYFKIVHDNGKKCPILAYKLINLNMSQNIAEMPSMSCAFTN